MSDHSYLAVAAVGALLAVEGEPVSHTAIAGFTCRQAKQASTCVVIYRTMEIYKALRTHMCNTMGLAHFIGQNLDSILTGFGC